MEDLLEAAEQARARGRPGEAAELLRRALDVAGDDAPFVAGRLARALAADGRGGEAELWARTAARGLARRFGEADPRARFAQVELADLLGKRGRLEDAERLATAAEEALRAAAPDGPEALRAAVVRARIASERGRLDEAAAHLGRALAGAPSEARAAVRGEALADLAQLLVPLGRLTDAHITAREGIAWCEARGEARRLPGLLDTLGCVLALQGRLQDAHAALERAMALHLDVHGPRDPGFVRASGNCAAVLAELDRLQEADALLGPTLGLAETVHGPEHVAVASLLVVRAVLDARLGRPGAAEIARDALARFERLCGEPHWRTRQARRDLADVLEGLLPAATDEPHVVLGKLVQRAARALDRREPDRAVALLEPLLAALPPGLEVVEQAALPLLALALAQLGRVDDARQALARADARREQAGLPEEPSWAALRALC